MTTHKEEAALIENILDLEKAIQQESDSNYVLQQKIEAHRHKLQSDILCHRNMHKDQMSGPHNDIKQLKIELHRQHTEALNLRLEWLTSST